MSLLKITELFHGFVPPIKKSRCAWDFFQCPGEVKKEIFLLVLGKGYYAGYCDEHALIKTELLKKSKLAIYKNLIEIENRIREKKWLMSQSNSNTTWKHNPILELRTRTELTKSDSKQTRQNLGFFQHRFILHFFCYNRGIYFFLALFDKREDR